MSSRGQTVSFLMQRFKESGIRLDTRRGQNFLVDLNLLQLLADSASITARDVVLEVGTGTGSLTSLLTPRAAAVITVEVAPYLFQLAQEEFVGTENVTMLQLDALKNKNRMNPQVMAAVQEQLNGFDERRFKLVANLPFNIATPVISNLLGGQLLPESMTVTIQKELADRIAALPGTKDYGALSIWIQSQCQVEVIRVMPPSAFWPRPKVHSAILNIQLDRARRTRIGDVEFFHTFVRAAFFHRRKYLRSVLLSAFKNRLDKPAVDQILTRLHLSPDTRAEQLDVETMLTLCKAVRAFVQEGD